ncbi:MAG TPA: hypothetical protein VN654_13820 [Vicinamibacterales bacterium]|jgi:hypothetical protein|nr:hypothetical protein [Vicinamibacterales bacterium]
MIDRRDWLRQTATLVTGAAAWGLERAEAQQRGDGTACRSRAMARLE